MSKWVLVESLITYRMRYMVEAPDDHPEYAMDTVTCEEAKEFSQKYLGEQIIDYRVMKDTQEALTLCDQDNDYLKNWTEQQKMSSLFTTMREQGYDEVEHSEFYYDTERNK
jgi:hypothetical protein